MERKAEGEREAREREVEKGRDGEGIIHHNDRYQTLVM